VEGPGDGEASAASGSLDAHGAVLATSISTVVSIEGVPLTVLVPISKLQYRLEDAE